ncbi:MAG: ATP-binding protein [Ignavibacteria bacterium]|jgi:PAS domain S-box-containing protein
MDSKRFAIISAYFTITIAIFIVIGWIFDIQILKTISPGLPSMKINTAVCFLLVGFTLLFIAKREKKRKFEIFIVQISILFVIVIGALSLLENLFGFRFGIDEFLVKDDTSQSYISHPGLMSMFTSLNYLLLGIALFLEVSKKFRFIVETLVSIVITISLLAFAGYVFRLEEIYKLGVQSTIAFHTSITFLIASISFILGKISIDRYLIIKIGFVVTIVTSLVIGSISYLSTEIYKRDTETLTLNSEIQLAIEELFVNIVTLHTNVRAYLLSSDNFYIKDFEDNINKHEIVIDRLYELTSGNPERQKQLETVRESVDYFINSTKEAVDRGKKRDRAFVRRYLQAREGEALKGYFENKIAEMEKEELGFREELANKTERSYNSSKRAILSTSILAIFFLLTLLILLTKEITLRRAAERHSLQIIESAPFAILLFDEDGKIYTVNSQLEKTFNYTRSELLKQPIGKLLPELYKDGNLDNMDDFIKKLESGDLRRYEDGYGIRKDGSNVPLDIALNPIKTDRGTMVITSLLDITRRKAKDKALKKLNNQLQLANKELESFSYSVSHDLRAPLRHATGFVNLLSKHLGEKLDDKGKRYFKTINDAAKKMGELIDDLLSFSRMGRTEMQKKEVDLGVVVNEVKNLLHDDFEEREVEWKIDDLPVVIADPNMLRLVFQNLLSNAIKYTSTREKALIEIGKEEKNGKVTIFVKDNGVGFDMKYADKLFGVFQRLHSSDEFEGTGIGLANIRRIINRHGGKTWAHGEPDKGATFYITIPKVNKEKKNG